MVRNDLTFKIFSFFFFLTLVIFIFRRIFILTPISGGDYLTFWPEFLPYFKNFSFSIWDSNVNLGWKIPALLHYAPYNFLIGNLGVFLENNFSLLERIFWWVPFLVLSIFSSTFLFKHLFCENTFWFLTPFVFVFNTYILMIVGGGQVAGIGLSYSLVPLSLYFSFKLIDSLYKQEESFKRIRNSLVTALIFSLQLLFDLRIPYVTGIGIGLYWIFSLVTKGRYEFKFFLLNLFFVFLLPIFVVFCLDFFWLFPFLLFWENPLKELGASYSTSEAVRFFSFAKFENSFSLLHPNWPENIFGKTYFMRPEFLGIPIIAYVSLFFISKIKNQKDILFFALLGLVGAFLAKGVNPPFGEVYLWLFKYFPGMIMFRDSTKFYILVALSYSVLIPYSLWQISTWINSKLLPVGRQGKTYNLPLSLGWQNFLGSLPYLLFTIYYLLLLRPALSGQLGGAFKPKEVPQEYVALKDFLFSQPAFFRTFWVPKRQRFGFYNNNHPAINSQDLLKASSPSAVIDWLKTEKAKSQLSRWAVKYVIVPYDSEGEIFLQDRKYDPTMRQKVEEDLKMVKWLKKLNEWEKVAVFETPKFKDHFWIEDGLNRESLNLTWQMVSPTKYEVVVKNIGKPFHLVFSESFDKNWLARIDDKRIYSQKTPDNLNSFAISGYNGSKIIVEYEPQRYVNYGLIISGLVLFASIGSLLWLKQKS